MKGKATGDLKRYFEELYQTASQGDAREESFYPALKTLLEQVAHSNGFHDLRVTILPTRTEGGNPDFRIWNGKDHIVGYVEAKKPTIEHLDQLEGSEQLQRYRTTFPNLILTNFFEFRLYRNGERVDSVLLGRPILFNQGLLPPVEKGEALIALLRRFFEFCLPQVNTAESLAVELAKRTRFLRESVSLRLQEEQAQGTGSLVGFYDAFKTYLIADLTPETFADLYAQTITYGLFAARTRTENGFNRRVAFDNIPPTIGILRDVFRYISFDDLPADIEWIVDDIAEVLAVTNVKEILDQYYRQHKGSDPIVHFYETFLKEYDPATRERRGVYYTPEPVVSYIVRSLHHLLQTQFHLQDGLASDGVTLLDPAAGTMTFVAHACQQAVQTFTQHYGTGALSQFIRERILRNFYAFELMMAPYAIGHLKMAFLLEELGYRLNDEERFQLYLTNALEMEDLQQSRLPGLASLAQESHLAGEVKKQKPILVILGNPPYSVSSANKSSFIEQEMEAYKTLVRNERNLMPLSDDYVKFLRFAQWKIEQRGEGIVGMITNHAYLDNPTFRGMRHSLMQTFDTIYLLNLHGNALKRETAPDGSADENVFDIRQGVVIAFFIKHQATPPNGLAKVYYADLYGTREHKYQWLLHHDIRTTEWQTLHPTPAFYLFAPFDEAGREQYDQFVPIPDIFPTHSTGIKTHRDHFVIDFNRDTLKNRIRTFLNPDLPDDMVRQAFQLRDTRDWKMSQKRALIQQDEDWEAKIVPCLYRPFDVRWMFYHRHAIELGREEVMRHLLAGENIAICVGRQGQVVGGEVWNLVFCATCIEDFNLFYRGGNVNFPLYLYPDASKHDLFSHHAPSERQPNLNPQLVERLAEAYGEMPSPEAVFHYIYAVLYAPTYRQKYAHFLKIDYPRIPFTADCGLFQQVAALGEQLVALHLLRSPALDPPAVRFQGEGSSRVEKVRYDSGTARVFLNASQYFEPVASEVWEYALGGYQVLEKWLKDRKGRELSLEEIRTYCRVATALQKTLDLQRQIDALYPQVEATILDLQGIEQG